MKKYDLIVVGGGISGVAAAVSAAREGVSVLLIEKTGSLGGAMSDSLVYPFMKFRVPTSGKYLSDGIFTEMRERHKKFNDNSFEIFKFVFDDMVTEAGVDVLFHATVFEAVTEDRRIKSVKVATKSGVMEFEAEFFVDTSGDGELLFMTGESDFVRGASILKERFGQIRLMNVTAGADGSYSFYGDTHVFVPSFRMHTIETTGAGDTFCACVLHDVLEHGLENRSEQSLGDMLRFANAAAAIITTRKGALKSMPQLAEVQRLLS